MIPLSETKRKLADINRAAEERDAERRAKSFGAPYTNLANAPLELDALSLLSREVAERAKIAVIAKTKNGLLVVTLDPTTKEAEAALKFLGEKHKQINVSVVSASSFARVLHYYDFIHAPEGEITGKVQINQDRLDELRNRLRTLTQAQEEMKRANSSSLGAAQFLEIFLASAVTLRASDIHLEPQERDVKFRLRIDGLLHDISDEINESEYFYVVSRIKLLSGLKLNIHETSQDGRFTVSVAGTEVEIRVSFLPSEYGETAVLRILDPSMLRVGLDALGIRPDSLELIKVELAKPNGMILNTGPTGSGKTTTLYSFLLHVQNPEIKIVTIEDPIEYRLPGIEQTQIDSGAGYTFENGLRAIVRQDPDVILVGEIRDLETAEIAMHASLTGHLVFSTLHTNDSFGTIPRLIDLGVKPTIIGPALNLAIAQRLVRRLCEKCKVKKDVSADVEGAINAFLSKLPDYIDRKPYSVGNIFEAKGCDECGMIGYKGRIAIIELLQINDDIEKLVYAGASEVDIKNAAQKQNMLVLQDDGVLRALQGVTTFKEVIRITGAIPWYKNESTKSEKE